MTHTRTLSVYHSSVPTRLLRGLLALCRVPVSSPQVPHRPDWGFCGWNSHRGLVFTRGPPRLYLCHKTVSTNVWRPLWLFLNDFYTFRPLNVNPLITMSKEMCLIGDVQTSEYVCVCAELIITIPLPCGMAWFILCWPTRCLECCGTKVTSWLTMS